MINLPEPFATENALPDNTPAFIVKFLESELSAEETTELDWGNNSSESNVNYTPSPPTSGDVILATTPLLEENLTSNTWSNAITVNVTGLVSLDEHWQSFQQTTSLGKKLKTVTAWLRQSATTDPAAKVDINCEIWSAGKGAKVVNVQTFSQVLPASGGTSYVFDFTSDKYVIEANTEYWVRIYLTNATSLNLVVDAAYQNTDVYANGQLDRTGSSPATNLGDLKFSVDMDDYYQASGFIMTQVMDLGALPTVPGEVVLKDIRPAGTAIVYEAWRSDTEAFAGEEVYVGVIVDGQIVPLSATRRFYVVKASLATTDQSYTPTLNSIKVAFGTYTSYADAIGFGYEPALNKISAFSTTIDTFKESTVGQMIITLDFTASLSTWMKTKYPKNKLVKILVGFKGFAEVDFIDYFWGVVDGWAITNKDKVTLNVKDYKKEWAVDVPSKWETTADDVTWTAMHPSDVVLDILQNKINVRNSKIDVSSFDILKALLPGWVVTRTITGNPEQADTLIHELMILMSAFIVPKGDGKISIKRFDPAEVPVQSITDNDIKGLKWDAKADNLINQVLVYTGWDGLGAEASNYSDLRLTVDVASQVNYDEAAKKEIRDKWTRPDAHTLLTNGDFEAGNTTGWALVVGGTAVAALSAVAAAEPYQGAWKGKVAITDGGTALAHVRISQDALTIVNGHLYRITFGMDTNVNYGVEVLFRQDATPFTWYAAETKQTINVTPTYQKYTVFYTANTDATDMQVAFYLGHGPTTVYIDEAVLVEDVTDEISDMTNFIIGRYADPAESFTFKADSRLIALEVGDIIDMTTLRAPSTDMMGIANEPMQVVRRNIDFKNDTIDFTTLRV